MVNGKMEVPDVPEAQEKKRSHTIDSAGDPCPECDEIAIGLPECNGCGAMLFYIHRESIPPATVLETMKAVPPDEVPKNL